MKSISQNYQLPLIKEAEYSKDVTSLLNTDFIQTVCVFNMFQIRLRNPLQLFNQIKSPDDFVFYLLLLFSEKLLKVGFVEDYCPLFWLSIHLPKIKNCCPKVKLQEPLLWNYSILPIWSTSCSSLHRTLTNNYPGINSQALVLNIILQRINYYFLLFCVNCQ